MPADAAPRFIEKPLQRAELSRVISQAMQGGSGAMAPAAPDKAAPASGPQAQTVLDERVLGRLLSDLGPERCRRIVDSYLDNAPLLSAELARNIGAGDLQAVAETAHKMVSAANVVGLTTVAAQAREVLNACRGGISMQLRMAVSDLRQHAIRSVPLLSDHFAKATGRAGRTT